MIGDAGERAADAAYRWSTSSKSAPAAARSPGSIRPAGCMSARKAPAPIRGPPATARASPDPVVTDADLVLGRLNPRALSQWRHEARCRGGANSAVHEKIGKPLGLSVRGGRARHRDDRRQRDVACGARGVGEQGRRSARHDADRVRRRRAAACGAPSPARSSFHAWSCRKLPGTFSALGMLMASWRQDFVRTLIGGLGTLDATTTQAAFAELARRGPRAARARRHSRRGR